MMSFRQEEKCKIGYDLTVDCFLGRDLLPYSKTLRKLSREVELSIKQANRHKKTLIHMLEQINDEAAKLETIRKIINKNFEDISAKSLEDIVT
ncbi:hypothetical protein BpHYR1_001726 [Brachionus plicatilis]|uniref:Uncharacterized protein n=1 Tax=Brachionus plicatilis TaxID=10195 RepID=A0A3M7SYY1_BRAPC|nr:hypothetical protein BpHYR1_001726 [Brachionus plicatilis]